MIAGRYTYALRYDGNRRVHHADDAISGRLGKIGDSISLSHRDDHKPLSPGTPPTAASLSSQLLDQKEGNCSGNLSTRGVRGPTDQLAAEDAYLGTVSDKEYVRSR